MDEIKALQEEFARAQMSGSTSKLSERNCIQIIQKLQELNMIDLMYTTDGKEYLTYDHLERQINDEIFVNGGRVTMAEIQESVSVDISRVEEVAQQVVKGDGDLHFLQNEIVSSTYLDTIAVEINELLIESGNVAIADLCTRFTLPSEFLLGQLEYRMGTFIEGRLDEFDRGSIFTNAFVARQTATILGVFSAITRPTFLGTMLSQYGFHQKLFDTVLQDLINSNQLAGSIQGGGAKASYVPDLQKKTQERWISNFFKSNNYIEYDAVKRLGIRNPKGHLKKIFPGGIALASSYLNRTIEDTVNSSVEEALDTNAIINIRELLPSPCTSEDANAMLSSLPCLKRNKHARVLCDATVCSDEYISKMAEMFKEPMENKAKEISQASKKKSLALAAGGNKPKQEPSDEKAKSVNFSDGPEPKSKKDKRNERKDKKTKRKEKNAAEDDQMSSGRSGKEQDEEKQYTFMTREELQVHIQKGLDEDAEEGVSAELAQILHSQLNTRFQEYVRECFLAGIASSGKKLDRKKLEETYSQTYINARLFQKGTEEFKGSDLDVLVKYLLKSLGQDMLNLLVQLRASEHFIDLDESTPHPTMNVDQRTKIVKQMPESDRVALQRLESLLNDKEIDSFLDPLEDVAENVGFFCKRSDKKRDRQVTFNHKLVLLQSLEQETSPPLVLHLVAILLFQGNTGNMLHAPGKCVPAIVTFLKDHLEEEVHALLLEYQQLVVASKSKANEEDAATGPTEEQTAALKKLLEKKPKN